MGLPSSRARQTREDDRLLEVPPAISCSRCGSASCDGCHPVDDTGVVDLLPWERRHPGWPQRLLATIELSVRDPHGTFGRLRRGSLFRACSFALVCELLALGSLFATAASLLTLAFPTVFAPLWADPATWLVGLALWTAASAAMVLLHAAWGLLLEGGVAATGQLRDNNLGLRFGLYACGWDALTSPLGLLIAVKLRGLSGLGLLLEASRAPRPAMEAYLRECRQLTETQRALVLRYAIGRSLLGLVVGLCAAIAVILVLAHGYLPT